MSEETFTVAFAEPNHLTDGDATELTVLEYDDLGSMY